MKRWLLCLVPWMAMTAVAQDVPRQATLVYTNVGPQDAWRVGDECYVPTNVLAALHWPYSLVGNDANIQAEDRNCRVVALNSRGRILVPLRSMLDQLGAVYSWRADGTTLDIYGVVRIVDFKDKKLTIDSTLSSKPHIFTLQNPPRIVVDMRGMKIDPKAANDLPDGVHASQYEPDTVRVVVESDEKPSMTGDATDATRHFELGIGVALTTRPVDTHRGDTNPPPIAAAPGSVEVGQMVSSETTSRSTTVDFPLSKPLAAPIMRQPDPSTIEITCPGAHYTPPDTPAQNRSIQSVDSLVTEAGTKLTLHLTAPMAVELTNKPNALELLLIKPVAGGGSLQGKVIVVDAGHGGTDTGARSPDKSVEEKDLTLSIAELLAGELEREGATVIMTRKTDILIPLHERPAIANRNNADFFISVHINSNKVANTQNGTIAFYHAQNPVGHLLAQCVSAEVGKLNGLRQVGAWSDTKIYNSGFAVLRGSTMPAILVESGYINNDFDREKMVTSEFQHAMARGIVRGLKVFLGDAKTEN